MKIRLVILAALLGLLAWGGWQEWQTHQRTATALRRLGARVSPWLKVTVPSWSAHFWHQGSAAGLTLAPQGTFHARLGLPFGYQARVDEVRVTDWQTGPAGDLAHVAGTFRGLRLPVPPVGDAPPFQLAGTVLPRITELGYATVTLDGVFDLELPATADGVTRLRARGLDPAFAEVALDCRVGHAGPLLDGDVDPVVPGACVLALADKGALTRLREALAAREHLGLTDFEAVMFARLDQATAAADWRWSPPDRQAAREFVHEPARLVVSLDPPGETPVSRWVAYRPGDLPSVLGLHLSTDPGVAPRLQGLPPMPAPSAGKGVDPGPGAGTGSAGSGPS